MLRIIIQRLNFVKLCKYKGIKTWRIPDSRYYGIADSLSVELVFWNPWSASGYSLIPKPRIPDWTSNFFCGFRNSSTGLPYLGNKYFFLIALHVRNIFARGIENPGLWDPEYSSRNPANDWNPESKFHLQRLRNQLFGIRNPWRGIQNPRLSWIPTEEKIDGNLPSACEEAFHLGDSREFTWELRWKGDESSRGRLSRLARHNWWAYSQGTSYNKPGAVSLVPTLESTPRPWSSPKEGNEWIYYRKFWSPTRALE